MELSRDDTRMLKGIAIMLMVLLHLFCRKEIEGLYVSMVTINNNPIEYYIGLFGDACRPIYLFVTGYAFYKVFLNRDIKYTWYKNIMRLFKLYINFWIMLIVFTVIAIFIGRADFFGDIWEYIRNFFLISYSYNGAWWFFRVYILIVLLSPLLILLVRKRNLYTVFFISGFIYFISYLQFYRSPLDLNISTSIEWTICLLGTSQFSFIIGAIFAKKETISFCPLPFSMATFIYVLGKYCVGTKGTRYATI